MGILLKNAQIITADSSTPRDKADILIENDTITAVEQNISEDIVGTEVIDASQYLVFPGFVDMHAHLREPGFEGKETIATGTRAAAMGGFTDIACMPNTSPSVDNSGIIHQIKYQSQTEGVVNVHPIAALTKGRQGEEMTEMDELSSSGAVGFSDDGDTVKSTEVMKTALEYAGMLQVPVISHCEDNSLSEGGDMNESTLSMVLGLTGIPNQAEDIVIARDLMLSELTDSQVHIAHVSTKGAVELIRRAKEKGLKVSAEVTPHHLLLNENILENYDPNTKVNPPLRSEEDRQALIQGIKDGTIDCIATDHAPHTCDEKNVEFTNAPFGLIGLETAFSAAKKALVDSGQLSMEELSDKLSVNPRKILKLSGGEIKEGASANLTLIDPNEQYVVNPEEFQSLGKNTPFKGFEFTGRVKSTIVNGHFVMRDGELQSF